MNAQKMIVNLANGSIMEFYVSEIKNIKVEESETQETPSIPTDDGVYHNGHEYVDLGLSVKWATCNIGAENCYDYGDYYAWGETETKSSFSTDTYKWYASSTVTTTDADGFDINMTYQGYTKYVTSLCAPIQGYKGFYADKVKLDTEDDAAHVNWGGNWRMPTYDELSELVSECTWIWGALNGVNGYKVTGPNGKHIFLPAAAFPLYNNDEGFYWSSSLSEDEIGSAKGLYFFSGYPSMNNYLFRPEGRSVRPVIE